MVPVGQGHHAQQKALRLLSRGEGRPQVDRVHLLPVRRVEEPFHEAVVHGGGAVLAHEAKPSPSQA